MQPFHITPRPDNLYFGLACLAIAAFAVSAILYGLSTGRPPFQKGLKGTSLATSKSLLALQVVLLAALATGSGFFGILLIKAVP